MPDFSEILKIAVEQQDWQLICGLYTNITGETLSVPTQDDESDPKEEEDILEKYFDTWLNKNASNYLEKYFSKKINNLCN